MLSPIEWLRRQICEHENSQIERIKEKQVEVKLTSDYRLKRIAAFSLRINLIGIN